MYPYIYIILPSYTLFAFIGSLIAIIFIYFRLDKFHIAFTVFLKLIFLCFIGGLIGSKMLFVITQVPYLINQFSIVRLLLLILQSGFVFYGGLFGVIITIILYTKKDTVLRSNIFKAAVPAIPLFHVFGRIGCFLAGCCYGKKLNSSFILFGLLKFNRIPVQIIEALFEFILFFFILLLRKKKPTIDILKIYLIFYAIFRFFIKFFRGDEIRGIFFGLSTAQWISIAILLYYIIKKMKK